MVMAKDDTLTAGGLRGVTGPMAKVSWADVPQINMNFGGASQAVNRTEMQDGNGANWALSTGNAVAGSGVGLGTAVRATRIGVRAGVGTSAQRPPADLIVDGRCVEAFSTTQTTLNGVLGGTWSDNEAYALFPLLLKPILHTAFVHLDPNPDGTTVNLLYICGWLLPRSDGFRDSSPTPRKGYLGNATTLTTTATALNVAIDSSTAALHLLNTDTAAAHLVTIYREDGTTLYDTVSVPQAVSASQPGSKDYAFPTDRNITNYKLKADAAAFVSVSPVNR